MVPQDSKKHGLSTLESIGFWGLFSGLMFCIYGALFLAIWLAPLLSIHRTANPIFALGLVWGFFMFSVRPKKEPRIIGVVYLTLYVAGLVWWFSR